MLQSCQFRFTRGKRVAQYCGKLLIKHNKYCHKHVKDGDKIMYKFKNFFETFDKNRHINESYLKELSEKEAKLKFRKTKPNNQKNKLKIQETKLKVQENKSCKSTLDKLTLDELTTENDLITEIMDVSTTYNLSDRQIKLLNGRYKKEWLNYEKIIKKTSFTECDFRDIKNLLEIFNEHKVLPEKYIKNAMDLYSLEHQENNDEKIKEIKEFNSK